MLLVERAWGESSRTRRGATLRQYSGMVWFVAGASESK